jgi:hypothetical protein
MHPDRRPRAAARRCTSTLLLLVTLALAGCFSIRYSPVPVDSPLPTTTIPRCAGTLLPGAACIAPVIAAHWQTPTGLQVALGQTYCVRVPPGQVWFDKGRRNIPPHGERGSSLMRLFDGLKRHPDSAWFSLVAAVVPADLAERSYVGPEATLAHQDLSRRPQLRISHSGALVLYPNDAIGPAEDPTWYQRNNRGQIWVTLQRCDGDCHCPVASLDN